VSHELNIYFGDHVQTLVLNASYEVMKIVNWRKAVRWFFLDKVDVIEEYSEYILTPSLQMKIPAVVKYRKLIKPKYRALKFSRINVYARDGFTCQYCARKFARPKLTLDHVIPKSRGGPSSWINCVACCTDCNVKKADKTPKEAGLKLLHEPRQPNQIEAFALAMRLKAVTIPEAWKNYSLPEIKI
jgi:5-methylcytosine-specific restriction endonuclease McrA